MKLPSYLTKSRATDQRFSIFFKWATLNLLAFFLLVAAYFQGLIGIVYAGDSSNIVSVICTLVFFSVSMSGYQAIQVDRGSVVTFNNLKYLIMLSNTSVMLGFIGTVVGIIIALQAVQVEAVGDVQAVGTLVAGLAQGMGIALYTTLVGGLGSMLIGFNRFILIRGVDKKQNDD